MKITYKRHQKQMQSMKNRLAELNTQLQMLRQEKALTEREEEVKELIADIHPTKKQAAIKRIKSVLGDFAELKKPLQRELRKELPVLKEDVKKFRAWHAKRKIEREKMLEKEYGGKRGKEEKMKHFWEA